MEDLVDGLTGFASHTNDPVQWCGHQPTSAAKRVPVPSVMLRHVMLHSVTSRKVTSRYVTLRYVTSCHFVMSAFFMSYATSLHKVETTENGGLLFSCTFDEMSLE
ncbi:hypothetical protein L798_08778 [Zootermopsis nevadensis]|uniref:Uncharacterized protein n=1 Tax=Zootermopsis nevadensis TaxID=136037 RepID=A0A067R308_ZOONE|nr:hypothetical protein L798_08778 [Zootermopsis nevadensis]